MIGEKLALKLTSDTFSRALPAVTDYEPSAPPKIGEKTPKNNVSVLTSQNLKPIVT